MSVPNTFLNVFDEDFIKKIVFNVKNYLEETQNPNFTQKTLLNRNFGGRVLVLGLTLQSPLLVHMGEEFLDSIDNANLQISSYHDMCKYCFEIKEIDNSFGKKYLEKVLSLWHQYLKTPDGSFNKFLYLIDMLKDHKLHELLKQTNQLFLTVQTLPLALQRTIYCKLADSMIETEDLNTIIDYLEKAERIQQLMDSKRRNTLSFSSFSNHDVDFLIALASATKNLPLLTSILDLSTRFSGFKIKSKVTRTYYAIGEQKKAIGLLVMSIGDLLDRWIMWRNNAKQTDAELSLIITEALNLANTCIVLKQTDQAKSLLPILKSKFPKGYSSRYWEKQGILHQLGELEEEDLKKEVNNLIKTFETFILEPHSTPETSFSPDWGDLKPSGIYGVNASRLEKHIDAASKRGTHPVNQRQISEGQRIIRELLQVRKMLKTLENNSLFNAISESYTKYEKTLRENYKGIKQIILTSELLSKKEDASPENILIHFTAGRIREAEALLREYEQNINQIVMNLPPLASFGYKLRLGELYCKLNQVDKAIPILKEYEEFPKDDKSGLELGRGVIHSQKCNHGLFLVLRLRIDFYLNRSFEIEKIIKECQTQSPEFLNQLGRVFIEIGLIEGANQILSILSSSFTDSSKKTFYYLLRASVLRKIGKKEEGLKALENYQLVMNNLSIRGSPGNRTRHSLLNEEYFKEYFKECLYLGDIDKAQGIIQEFFESPLNFSFYNYSRSFAIILCQQSPPPDMNIQIWSDAKNMFEQKILEKYRRFSTGEMEYSNFEQINLFLQTLIALQKHVEAKKCGTLVLNTLENVIRKKLKSEIYNQLDFSEPVDVSPWNPTIFFEKLQRTIRMHSKVGSRRLGIYLESKVSKDFFTQLYFSHAYKSLAAIFRVVSDSLRGICEKNYVVLRKLTNTYKTSAYPLTEKVTLILHESNDRLILQFSTGFSRIEELKPLLHKGDYYSARELIEKSLKKLNAIRPISENHIGFYTKTIALLSESLRDSPRLDFL